MKPILLAAFMTFAAVAKATVACADEPSPRLDLYGDPLPPGALARLGTARLRDGTDYQKHLAFTADGGALVVATEASEIIFWDTSSGKRLKTISLAPKHLRGFAMSTDGKLLAATLIWFVEEEGKNEMKAEVQLIDAAMGCATRVLPRESRDVDYECLALTPDGRHLISLGERGKLRVEDTETGFRLLEEIVPTDNGPRLTLSRDGATVAICTGPNTEQIFVWEWRSGAAPREFKPYRPGDAYVSLAFSPDGKRLAGAFERADDQIQIWNVETGEIEQRFKLPVAEKYLYGGIGYSPDGAALIATGRARMRPGNEALHIWDATSGEYRGSLASDECNTLAISPDGRFLAAPSGVGVKLWKWPTREEALAFDEAHRHGIGDAILTGDGKAITASDDYSIRFWELATARQLRVVPHDFWARSISLSPDGSRLASSGFGDSFDVWKLATGDNLATSEHFRLRGLDSIGGGIRDLAFSRDGEQITTLSDKLLVRRWSAASGKAVYESNLRPTGVTIPTEDEEEGGFPFSMRIQQATLSSDGSIAVVAIGKLFVFDAKSGEERLALENPGSHVVAIAVSPDNRFMLASAWGKQRELKLADGRIRTTTQPMAPVALWNLASGELLHLLEFPDNGAGEVAFSPSGDRFAVAIAKPDFEIRIYETAGAKERQSIAGVPGRVRSLCFSPDGKTLLAGMADSTALVWELK